MGNTSSSSSTNQEQIYQSYIDKQFETIKLQQYQMTVLIKNLQDSQNPQINSEIEKLRRINLIQKQKYLENINKLKKYKENKNLNDDNLLTIKNKLDPYKILNIGKKYTKTDLKKAYLKAALQHHPDRGGSEEIFQTISISYKVLLKKIEQSDYHNHNDLKESLQKSEFKEHKEMKEDHFNISKFNNVYETNRIQDIYDKGYGDWIQSKEQISEHKDFNGKFNKSMFNNEFESMKQRQKKVPSDKIIMKDPDKFISYKGSDSIVELGKKNVNNFSGESGGLSYRDLRDAFENSTLIDVQTVDLSNRRDDLNKLKSDRKNISYKMSTKENNLRSLSEEKLQECETDRLQRIRETDQIIFNQYQKNNFQLH